MNKTTVRLLFAFYEISFIKPLFPMENFITKANNKTFIYMNDLFI